MVTYIFVGLVYFVLYVGKITKYMVGDCALCRIPKEYSTVNNLSSFFFCKLICSFLVVGRFCLRRCVVTLDGRPAFVSSVFAFFSGDGGWLSWVVKGWGGGWYLDDGLSTFSAGGWFWYMWCLFCVGVARMRSQNSLIEALRELVLWQWWWMPWSCGGCDREVWSRWAGGFPCRRCRFACREHEGVISTTCFSFTVVWTRGCVVNAFPLSCWRIVQWAVVGLCNV